MRNTAGIFTQNKVKPIPIHPSTDDYLFLFFNGLKVTEENPAGTELETAYL